MRQKLAHVRPSWRAVCILWREELSFRIQTVFGAVIILLSFVLGLSKIEFLMVLIATGTVLATEALNTAIEELCNHVTPEEHPRIGKVKDLGSGASLLIGVTAIIVGLVIFIPHLI